MKIFREGLKDRPVVSRLQVLCRLSVICALIAPGLTLGIQPLFAQPGPFVMPLDSFTLSARQSEVLSAIKSLPTTKDTTVVRLNIDALRDGDQISIPLKSKSIPIWKSSRQSSDGNTIWFGTAPNETTGSTAIVANKQNVTGTIQTEDGLYQIRPLGDGLHALVKVDTGKFPPEHPRSD